MKRILFLCAAAATVLALTACESSLPTGTDGLADDIGSASKATQSTSNVYWFGAPPPMVAGASSKLVRNANGVRVTFQTNGLTKGDAYTIWWVVFNHPDQCLVDGDEEFDDVDCSLTDLLFNAAVESDLLWAAGHVSGGQNDTFAASLPEGDRGLSILPEIGFPAGPGLIDAGEAEIHLVVRSHGPSIPGVVDEQISTFNGGCPPNTCEDLQFAIHQP